MAKDPAFLFYSQDFIVGVQTLDFEDRGKYITLLAQMHQQGRMSEKTICFLVGNPTENLKSKFRIDENGLWYNERLELEAKKRVDFTESRRANGLKGGRPKKNKKPSVKPKKNHMDNHMENENENENENGIGGEDEKKEPTLFKKCQADWSDRYYSETELKYQWNSAEGKTLKSLIAKLRNLAKQQHEKDKNEKPVTDAEVFTFWEHLLNKLPKWYAEKGDLKIINSKFNEIVREIKSPYTKGKRMVKTIYEEFGIE